MGIKPFWFKHDKNFSDDNRVKIVKKHFGFEGYGIYIFTLELLLQSNNKIKKDDLIELINLDSSDQEVAEKVIKKCLQKDLIKISDDNYVSSKFIENTILNNKTISEKRSLSGKAGGIVSGNARKKTKQTPSKREANPKQNEANAKQNEASVKQNEANVKQNEASREEKSRTKNITDINITKKETTKASNNTSNITRALTAKELDIIIENWENLKPEAFRDKNNKRQVSYVVKNRNGLQDRETFDGVRQFFKSVHKLILFDDLKISEEGASQSPSSFVGGNSRKLVLS